MKLERVLFLGAVCHQIPIIKEAKKRGYYVATCDYLPENPGHKFADEYHNVSTTEKDKVLRLAKKVKADLVIAYATDPAAIVAAYVSEKLGLPGNSVKSVTILANKDLFREFQRKHHFHVPNSILVGKNSVNHDKISELTFPVLIKPSDSSGSKGISKIFGLDELEPAIDLALTYSRNKRIIAEEFIECSGNQIHGDGFVVDGKLEFSCLGDHHYHETINPFVPYSTTWPSAKPKEIIELVNSEVNRLIHEVGFLNGPINIEARINRDGKIYLVEIGPRNGGNFVPQVIHYATGVNLINAVLDVSLGTKADLAQKFQKYSAYYVVHADKDGILEKISIADEIKQFVKEFHQYTAIGEVVNSFQNSSNSVGLAILQFNSRETMEHYVEKMWKYIRLKIR